MENYLKQAVGTLPTDSFLCNTLNYVFGDYPYLKTIQEDVYGIIQLFLSETNHPDVNQFQDISLHDNNVSGDRHVQSVSEDNECENFRLTHDKHDKTLEVTLNNDDTFYMTNSLDLATKLQQVQSVYCTSSCPDLDQKLTYKPQIPPYPVPIKTISHSEKEELGDCCKEHLWASMPIKDENIN